MNASIYQNLRTDKQYKASTGLSLSEFEHLYSFFENLYISKIANPYLSESKHPVLTQKREALFFILYYYKAYPTLVNLGLSFGFSEKTSSQYIEQIKPILKASYQQAGIDVARTFGSQQHFDEVFANEDKIIIDVTECETNRPQNDEKQEINYSGKKKGQQENG